MGVLQVGSDLTQRVAAGAILYEVAGKSDQQPVARHRQCFAVLVDEPEQLDVAADRVDAIDCVVWAVNNLEHEQSVYRIMPDHSLQVQLTESIVTVQHHGHRSDVMKDQRLSACTVRLRVVALS